MNYIRDCFHKMSRLLLSWCYQHNVGTIVLGSNAFWKQKTTIGKKNNQSFVSIPFEMLKTMIEQKSCEYGITVMRNEESYTSKVSFLDKDEIPVYKEGDAAKHQFSGKRIQRGIYRSANGILLNADINGATNIFRKAGFDASNMVLEKLLAPEIIGFKKLNQPM